MFDKQYRFFGRHAERVDALTSVFDEYGKAKLFDRNVDVYVNAPLIGFLFGRKAERDTSPGANEKTTNIMGDRVIYSSDKLKYNYRMIMMLDSNSEPDAQKRLDKAFRTAGSDSADMELFDCYVRGGVDVLYEKLVEGAKTPDDYVERLFEFIDEFHDRFNSMISYDAILEKCKSAQS